MQGNRPIFGTASFLHSVCAWGALQVFHRESSEPPASGWTRIQLLPFTMHAGRRYDARRKALALKADSSPGQRALPFAEARTAFVAFKRKHLRPRSRQEMTRNITKHPTWSKALDTANEPGGTRFADKHDHGSADVDARRCEFVRLCLAAHRRLFLHILLSMLRLSIAIVRRPNKIAVTRAIFASSISPSIIPVPLKAEQQPVHQAYIRSTPCHFAYPYLVAPTPVLPRIH
jgi:hypothetical protein